jgi:hypothetical protein
MLKRRDNYCTYLVESLRMWYHVVVVYCITLFHHCGQR